jgi:hypothetical protein
MVAAHATDADGPAAHAASFESVHFTFVWAG